MPQNDAMSQDRESFDRTLREKDLLGYWMIPSRSDGYREPQPRYAPKLWNWPTLRGALDEAAIHITKEEAHRRFIGLQHPDLEVGTTPNLMLGAQLIRAGEMAPPHRHTMDAIRFVVEGDGGACTVVEGERFHMSKGDLITTPNWSWHDHINESEQDTVWLDGAVAPLIMHFGIGFAEPHQQEHQPVAKRDGWSSLQFGPLQPRRPDYSRTARRPPYRYSWADASRALSQLAEAAPEPHDDTVLHYADPVTGGPTLATIDCELQQLRPGFSGGAHRHTHATIYHVVAGEGTSVIGDSRIEWRAGDSFVVPVWSWHRHANAGSAPAILFSISDKPLMHALGFDREESDSQSR
jgi:1-hydroxy-2-naphthoate dioxygenase